MAREQQKKYRAKVLTNKLIFKTRPRLQELCDLYLKKKGPISPQDFLYNYLQLTRPQINSWKNGINENPLYLDYAIIIDTTIQRILARIELNMIKYQRAKHYNSHGIIFLLKAWNKDQYHLELKVQDTHTDKENGEKLLIENKNISGKLIFKEIE